MLAIVSEINETLFRDNGEMLIEEGSSSASHPSVASIPAPLPSKQHHYKQDQTQIHIYLPCVMHIIALCDDASTALKCSFYAASCKLHVDPILAIF